MPFDQVGVAEVQRTVAKRLRVQGRFGPPECTLALTGKQRESGGLEKNCVDGDIKAIQIP